MSNFRDVTQTLTFYRYPANTPVIVPKTKILRWVPYMDMTGCINTTLVLDDGTEMAVQGTVFEIQRQFEDSFTRIS